MNNYLSYEYLITASLEAFTVELFSSTKVRMGVGVGGEGALFLLLS